MSSLASFSNAAMSLCSSPPFRFLLERWVYKNGMVTSTRSP